MAVHPRRPKGPPLNALRAFEAAARLQSFVAAAEELNVTPGAVSQHIKALEGWAGTALFVRNPQGVALLPAGRSLADEFTQAFDHLAAATQSLRNLAPSPEIHIAALPSVAQLWLPPRLGKLRELRPDLNFSITALENPPRLSRELFDMSVFFCGLDEFEDQIVLAEDPIFPVCSPKLTDSFRLDTIPLLHDQTWKTDWMLWSETTGVPVGDPSRGPQYSLYALAVEEAKSGAGALMGHGCLIEKALKSGELMRLSAKDGSTGRALTVQLPHPSRRHPDIEEVVGLLRDIRIHRES
ncbi:LysR family transcriptional regulator [Ruegeria lacuscaerulensis]|uniref:LysR family transcriptional regulator n=1 Tax=Ruegeria lacuscaerulensis TaxID=55218 RepID=UPI00147C1D5C|nr:LysR family transcriptional regulator [Ruegeria lacuscaerulensis]